MRDKAVSGDLTLAVTNPDEKPPFLPILGYVLGFMVALAILAFVVVAIMRVIGR